MGNDSEKRQHFLQHKEKHKNNMEGYTDESKSKESKIGFSAVFTEKASIHTPEMTAMRATKKR